VTDANEPVSAIRNLGRAAARAGHRRGLPPPAGRRRAAAFQLQGRPWNDCRGKEKAKLRARFDAIKATAHDKGRSDLEAALDRIGVGRKR